MDIPAYATDNKAIAIVDDGVASNIEDEQSSSVYFGNYKQSSDGSDDFDNEPIKWRVLKNNITNKTLFLLADKNLDCKQYSSSPCTWETCTLRKWLNGLVDNPYTDNFLEAAFSSEEQGSVATTEVVNPENPDYHIPGGNNTSDRVFILSVAEANDSNYGFTGDDKRISANTDYARDQNAYDDNGNGFWWLRTPGGSVGRVTGVLFNGFVHTGGAQVTENQVAVRPAFNLDLSSIILTSAAESGKDADSTLGTLKQVVDYAGSDWKLTLHDTSRDGTGKFTASAATGATLNMAEGYTSWTVPVTYSGAETGTNEYVSAILTDSSGVALYYGHIANDSAASSDTGVDVTIPTGLSAGTYTLNIFNEQCNGDKKTDYASAFSPIGITVSAQAPLGAGKNTQLGAGALADNAGASGAATVYYGKNDQTWRVIGYGTTGVASTSGKLALLAGSAMSSSKFNNENVGEDCNNYAGSLLKNAVDAIYSSTYFTEKEMEAIIKRDLNVQEFIDTDLYTDGISGTALTGDNAPYLWPLSTKEAYTLYDNGNGLEIISIENLWWLRSPGVNDFTAVLVDDGGNVFCHGLDVYILGGVRPAFNLNLSSIILTSAASGGKSSGTTGAGALTAPDNYTESEWKLTVNDTSRSGFAVNRLGSGEIAAGGNMRFNYSGAKKADNEYVSVLLLDESGSLLAYGRIVNTSSSTSGTSYITLPSTLVTDGNTYTLQFVSEQCNGDKKTDYSSLPSANSFTFIVGKGTPTAVDFDVTLPTDTTYDGNAKTATAVVQTGVSGMGDITVQYKDANDYVSTTAPTDPGTYQVILNVAEGTNYNAGIGVTDDSWTFTITNPSHNHSYSSSVIKEPTCTETGTRRYTCSCGYSYTETIPALGHDYVGTITKYASTQEDGIMTYTCSRCHDSYTEVIPKHEPTLEEGIDEIKQLIGELEGDDGEHKVEVDVKTEKKDDGTTETVVTVGDEEILKITTDEDGEEEIESNIWSIGGDGNFTYTGVAIKPEILVFDGLKRLSLGSDFTVSYKNNVNAGAKAEAKVSFKGRYKGTPAIKTNFTIDQADLEKNAAAPAMIIASTGKTQKPIPEITITESGKSLGKSDLEYTYLDSEKKEVSGIKDAGDYFVEAGPKKTGGNLTGKITVPITVTGDKTKLLSNGKINLAKKSYVYTGKPIIPDKDTYGLTIDGTKLTEGKDYTLTITNNIEPGKATMTFIALEGNADGYVGSIKAVFTITKGKELKPAGDGSDFKYTYEENAPFAKGGAKPEVTVKDGDKTLTKDVDYKVSYDKNKKITEGKTAVMQVSGMGIYKGKVNLYYAVVPQDIAALAGGIEVMDKAVSSKGYKNPKVTITDENGKTLSKNNDYEFVDDYTEPDEKGSVTVTIKGKGAYTGTVPVTYRYLEAAALIDKVNASKIADKTYTGSPIRLTKKEAEKLLYTGKGKNINYLTWKEDFEIVRYENNTKPGTAKVILRGIGTHGGTRTVTFKIKSAKKTGLKIIISKLFNK